MPHTQLSIIINEHTFILLEGIKKISKGGGGGVDSLLALCELDSLELFLNAWNLHD